MTASEPAPLDQQVPRHQVTMDPDRRAGPRAAPRARRSHAAVAAAASIVPPAPRSRPGSRASRSASGQPRSVVRRVRPRSTGRYRSAGARQRSDRGRWRPARGSAKRAERRGLAVEPAEDGPDGRIALARPAERDGTGIASGRCGASCGSHAMLPPDRRRAPGPARQPHDEIVAEPEEEVRRAGGVERRDREVGPLRMLRREQSTHHPTSVSISSSCSFPVDTTDHPNCAGRSVSNDFAARAVELGRAGRRRTRRAGRR